MNMLNEKTVAHNEQQLNICKNDILLTLSNIEKYLESIAYSLDYFVFNDERPIDKLHVVQD